MLEEGNILGPLYRTEVVSDEYHNYANTMMHIFDFRFAYNQEIGFIDLVAECGPTIIIPGNVIGCTLEDIESDWLWEEG